jgi:mRNA-degrading endonuclease RelE of RelBE toxin-antitoxin system
MSLRRPIRTTDEISTYIRTLHPALKKRIHNALEQIRMQPGEGKPLQRELAGYRSFKIGKFRIIYRASMKEIEIVAVGPRRTIYEEAARLMAKQADANPRKIIP